MRGLGISSSREMLHRVVCCCWFMGHEGFRGGRFFFFWEMCIYIYCYRSPLLPRESVVTRHMVSPHYPHVQAAKMSNDATMMSGKQIQWFSCRLLLNRLLHVAILEQRVSRRIQRPLWNVQLCKVREGVDDDGGSSRQIISQHCKYSRTRKSCSFSRRKSSSGARQRERKVERKKGRETQS